SGGAVAEGAAPGAGIFRTSRPGALSASLCYAETLGRAGVQPRRRAQLGPPAAALRQGSALASRAGSSLRSRASAQGRGVRKTPAPEVFVGAGELTGRYVHY